MHSKSILVGALAAASMVAAQEPAHLVPRDSSASSPTPTKKGDHTSAAWETADPSAAAKYHADMKSLRSSIKNNPLWTSMKGALATAIPQSYKSAMHTNPASLNRQFSTTQPDWYKALPSDVRSFIETNQKAAKSIAEKDLGPRATEVVTPGVPGTQSVAGNKGAKSEASALGIIGATVGTLAGALGVAILLL